jgi:hypothetical protein
MSLSLADFRGTNNASLTTPWKPDPINEDEKVKSGERSPDSAKLKGVLWPGMNVFDSATPEMKRMRNQRKDGSILEQMLATSIEIEPAEISYHANGEFRASRDIFGPLSTENTPVGTEVVYSFHSQHILTPNRNHHQRSGKFARTLLSLRSPPMFLGRELHEERRPLHWEVRQNVLHQCNPSRQYSFVHHQPSILWRLVLVIDSLQPQRKMRNSG